MYKVLIADDERIIREGIANSINWEENGFTLLGTATDGIDAYEKIKDSSPDIVITDIIMPGMNGLDLIAKVSEEYKDITFIILSGHGEFDYANRAMSFGVKHYILKPCDESAIIPVLEKVKKEKDEKESFLENINYNLKKVIPEVKEQFLREIVIGGRYSSREIDYFRNLFEIEEDQSKLIILKIDGDRDLLEKFALKNISCELIGENRVYLSSIVEDNIVMIIKSIDLEELSDTFTEIKEVFFQYFKAITSIAVSNENSFNNIQEMYNEVKECLKYEFYLGEGSIITNNDIKIKEIDEKSELKIDYDAIGVAIKTGDVESINLKLKNIFEAIDKRKLEIEVVKNYCIELFLVIIRQQLIDEIREYSRGINKIDNMNTLTQIYDFIKNTAHEIAVKNYENTNKNYGMIINEVVKCIEDNISNENLSLTWIAKEVLFMNENYLGKLFHKQTNEKFSQYVMKVRMEKAKELIMNNDYKIYEITESVGFADNTQYFSQVFKKYTGYTPSEFKKL
jgi:two-component system response regulator YesN